jgi:hypothetical protein
VACGVPLGAVLAVEHALHLVRRPVRGGLRGEVINSPTVPIVGLVVVPPPHRAGGGVEDDVVQAGVVVRGECSEQVRVVAGPVVDVLAAA